MKSGFVPEAVLEELYRLTPMEDSFGINNVALVEGQPRTLGLVELLSVFVDFRIGVVRRRTAHRLAKREERLHLVDGLVVAILNIDEVIQLIRAADDTATARARLMGVFDLSEAQATYILELQLRRLTKFSRLELEKEQEQLRSEIEALRAVLSDERLLRRTVSDELAEVAQAHATPRRTVLLESAGAVAGVTAAAPARGQSAVLEIADDPCWVLLSSTGLLARTTSADDLPTGGGGPGTMSSSARCGPPPEARSVSSRAWAGCCASRFLSCRRSPRPPTPPICPAVLRWRHTSSWVGTSSR